MTAAGFNKGPNPGGPQVAPNGQPAAGPTAVSLPPQHQDPTQGQGFMDSGMVRRLPDPLPLHALGCVRANAFLGLQHGLQHQPYWH